jgi:hypothetical protein
MSLPTTFLRSIKQWFSYWSKIGVALPLTTLRRSTKVLLLGPSSSRHSSLVFAHRPSNRSAARADCAVGVSVAAQAIPICKTLQRAKMTTTNLSCNIASPCFRNLTLYGPFRERKLSFRNIGSHDRPAIRMPRTQLALHPLHQSSILSRNPMPGRTQSPKPRVQLMMPNCLRRGSPSATIGPDSMPHSTQPRARSQLTASHSRNRGWPLASGAPALIWLV